MSANRNQNVSLGYYSDPFRQISNLSTIALSGTFTFTGAFTVDPNIDFSSDTTSYHIRAVNSALILSSSANSSVTISGTLHATDDLRTNRDVIVTRRLSFSDINTAWNISSFNSSLVLSSSAGSNVVVSGTFAVGDLMRVTSSVALGPLVAIGSTAVPVARFYVASGGFIGGGSVALFETGQAAYNVSIARGAATGTQVMNLSLNDSTAFFHHIQDENVAHIHFLISTGSTGAGGTGRARDLLFMSMDENNQRLYLNGAVQISGTVAGAIQGLLDVRTGEAPLSCSFFRSSPSVTNRGGIMHHQDTTFAWKETVDNTGATTGLMRFQYANRTAPETFQATNVLCLRGDGRVGINNAAPNDALDVTGDVRATGGFKHLLSGMWVRQNHAVNTKAEMGHPNLTTVGYRVVMPYAGSIMGISAREYNGTAVAAGNLTFSASINGTANATIISTMTTGQNSTFATFAKDTVTFAAGDSLSIFIAADAAFSPTGTPDYHAFLTVEF